MVNPQYEKYRGKRALILTRVSGKLQAQRYGHPAQERQIREDLITPLELRILDEEKFIIHDTYSGLEYKYREALGRILEMAERGEFDVLCMEVLDRGLGRRALARELYRMQLKELGIGILTTGPQDFSDDDTLTGQIMRFHKGIKAEEEITDMVRRTKRGRREKALSNKIVGQGTRRYGYKFVCDERGKRIGYILNEDLILEEPDGTKWTEVKVIVFIFESAANGVTLRQIAIFLNNKGIPCPTIAKGIKRKSRNGEPWMWQPATIGDCLRAPDYWGEKPEFRTRLLPKKPSEKFQKRQKTNAEERVIVSIPAIVTKELAERAREQVRRNQKNASRNNPNPQESLLRVGHVKCAECGGTMTVHRTTRKRVTQPEPYHFPFYLCVNGGSRIGICRGNSISVNALDTAAWEYAVDIIRDPSVADKRIQELLAEYSPTKQQQRKMRHINDILREQENYRKNLAVEMRKHNFSERTVAYLNAQITALEQEEEKARQELADEQLVQQEQKKLQDRIADFHKRCAEMREKLVDPEFTPDYDFKRDAIEFFGITATVWKHGAKRRYKFSCRPENIVSSIS